jgi:hypothetical protein
MGGIMKLGTATAFADGKLTYHQTVVCELLDDGQVRLDSGGYRTATTKKRMNQFSGMIGSHWYVFQRDGEWFVEYLDFPAIKPMRFEDGMIIERSVGLESKKLVQYAEEE